MILSLDMPREWAIIKFLNELQLPRVQNIDDFKNDQFKHRTR